MTTVAEQHQAAIERLEGLQAKRAGVDRQLSQRQDELRELREVIAAVGLDSDPDVIEGVMARVAALELIIKAGQREIAELDGTIKIVKDNLRKLNQARAARERELAEAAHEAEIAAVKLQVLRDREDRG